MSVRPTAAPRISHLVGALPAALVMAASVTSCAGPTRLPASSTNAHAPTAPPERPAPPAGARVVWSEHFSGALDWVDPFGHDPSVIARVYSVASEGPLSFLRARHEVEGVPSPTPAIHLGRAFASDPPSLASIRALRWRWRVNEQPRASTAAPWADLAASVYVVVEQPSILVNGTGFKLGWLAIAGPSDTSQRGLAQLPLRVAGATGEWQSEEIDVCALYRERFGPCEGQSVRYIGVVTDADNTRSRAAADYADFELLVTAP
jgi:hypothetical protein